MVTPEEDAQASAVLSKAKAENFPVAPRFLPRAWRDDLMAVYGFARLVDDIGDGDLDDAPEHARTLGLAPDQAGDTLAMLDAFEADLLKVFDGSHQTGGAAPSPGGGPAHPLLRALVPTVHRRGLTAEPFLPRSSRANASPTDSAASTSATSGSAWSAPCANSATVRS